MDDPGKEYTVGILGARVVDAALAGTYSAPAPDEAWWPAPWRYRRGPW